MNICLDGLKSGSFCFGDSLARLHGTEYGLTHTGLGMLALIGVAMVVYVFRDPA
ncbi:hypothetical protein [Jannaschia rubra]|uniref:Uncharacterized protein n=1 Tax=Jannaschia rubra TaxID=282197 RepID=A0A0M6XP95_9RHOB|nr:hypothetical protein [Jannaschia rubra]CTQ32909.1 hypothetical protein JAN5088_01683 [Jannaschia rubra]SFG27872.1 hypothetical protein SAMN04488517_103435 [Jannaschia rubra]